MFCNKCGTQLKENARFCPKCGSPVAATRREPVFERNTPQPTPAAPRPRSGVSTVLIVLIAVFGTALIAAVGILVYTLSARNITENVVEPIAETAAAVQEQTAPREETVGEKQEEIIELSSASAFSGATASSVLADQAGHSYAAENVLKNDGACWCEGASDYGEGEWIRLDLPEKQLLSGLKIVNGYAGTAKQYSSNSKPEEIKIEFSDGRSVNVDLEVFSTEKRKSTQDIRFSSPVATEYVRITIVSVAGSEYKDTCLSYVEPY
ncbi:MAG: discoidin domain-containing protein [Ruminococcus sp.]|nr:discoidin domain-containing protein [Ruminococcus sp.]